MFKIKRALQAALVALLVSTTLALPVLADSRSERIAVAKEVIQTTDNETVVKTVVNAMMHQIKQLMMQAHPGRKNMIEAALEDSAKEIVRRRGELHDEIAVVYADQFAIEELRELLKFYQGPLGQKFLKKMPIVTQKTIALGQKWGRSVASDVIETVQTEMNK